MALQYWQNRGEDRRVIVALENAYHGDTFGAMSVSARGLFTDPFKHQMFDVIHFPHASDFQRLVLERGKDIAALIVEPMVQGAGGMLMWPAESLAALRQITESAGIPLIADEVMTGFGRTGPLFACEHAGISPDLMCLSKGITGGFLPLGATLARGEIFDAFWSDDRRKTLFHGHSFTANPITCAASLASLALLDDACAARRTAIKTSHRKAAESFSQIKALKNIRVLGTILAADFVANDSGYLSGVGPALRAFALERGVLLRPLGDTVYILPPYCVTDDDLTKAYDVIAEFAESR
jgi:adenosylmethionine-8-amino-7-oxononanoate aminotransferase